MTEDLKLTENEIKILKYARDCFVEAMQEHGMEQIEENRKLSGITRTDLYMENEEGVRVVPVGRSRVWNILNDSLIKKGLIIKLEKFNNPKYFHITSKGLNSLKEMGDVIEVAKQEEGKKVKESSLAQFYSKKVRVICPVCKISGEVGVPEEKVLNNNSTTTISVPAGLICEHHFQAFLDRNFAVRGYQRVDVDLAEINNSVNKVAQESEFVFPPLEVSNYPQNGATYEDFENCIKELYRKQQAGEFEPIDNKPKTLREIYLDFRVLIPDNNKEFSQFIEKDPYRKTIKDFALL